MLARSRVALILIGMLLLLLAPVLVPMVTNAVGTAADAMCLPDAAPDPCQCGPKFVPKKGCSGAPTKFMCPCSDSTSGFTTSGKCVNTFKCEAMGTSDGKLDQGMSKLGEMLGKLMEALKGKDGGGGGGSPTDQNGNCITMQPTGDKSLADTQPMCYFYSPGLATTTPEVTYDPSGGLVAIPTEGETPLKVTFAFTNGTSACNTPQLVLDYADGEKFDPQLHAETGCRAIQESVEHTFNAAGTFAVRLKDATTGDVRGGVNLTITAGANPQPNTGGTGTGGTNTGGTGTGGTNTNATGGSSTGGTNSTTNATTPLFTTPLTNLNNTGSVRNGTSESGSTGGSSATGGSSTGGSASTGGTNNDNTGASLNFNNPQSIVQSIVAKNLPPGAYGDVKILSNGTTIIAGVREGKTEVAGFFGTNSTSGGQSAVAKMCVNRPWSKNFLSYVIPPSFFDSLCSWRGYQVGGTTTTTTTTTTTAKPTPAPITIGQGTKTTVTKTTVGGTTPPKATTTAPMTAKVDIWATPTTVPLGARTSIFWNTQGVSDCIETSPDGSFTQTSLKGGASTVPLTQATTFTISCVAPNGAHITDSVVVQIAL